MEKARPKANVYVDGFNLYYGALKERYPEQKWLDVRALAEILFPGMDICDVHYFTAVVTERADRPGQPERQEMYLRALRARDVEVHYGYFLERPKWMRRVESDEWVEVVKPDEKMSDVSLGAYLVRDSFVGDIQAAIVISNDTDLIEALRMVRGEAGIYVGLVSPFKQTSRFLKAEADYEVRLNRRRVLISAQLPADLRDEDGEICCPEEWISP